MIFWTTAEDEKDYTFQMLLNVIAARITRLDTRFRNCVPPKKVLALGLFRLAHGNSYISIAPAMNVGKSTVIKAVQDVVESLFDLRNEYIKFPETEQETAALIRTFEECPDLPNIAGAIDGTRIRIEAPKDSAVDYFSRYQQHDFVVQAVVDSRGEQFLLIDHRINRKTDDRPFLARFLMLT